MGGGGRAKRGEERVGAGRPEGAHLRAALLGAKIVKRDSRRRNFAALPLGAAPDT